MNKVSYVLKYPKERKSPIIMTYTCEDEVKPGKESLKVLKYATGESILTADWDNENQQPVWSKIKAYRNIGQRMRDLNSMMVNYYDECKKKNIKLVKEGLQTYCTGPL